MSTINCPEDALQWLGEEKIKKGSELSSEKAQKTSRAWRELALALAMPESGAPLSAAEAAAQKEARPVIDTIWKNLFSEAWGRVNKNESLENMLPSKTFRSAQRFCKDLGLSADRIDEAWDLGFNEVMISLSNQNTRGAFRKAAQSISQQYRVSQTLEWGLVKEAAFEALQMVCFHGSGAERLGNAGAACAEALDRMIRLIENEEGPAQAKAWMKAADARVARALLEVCEVSATAVAEQSPTGHENRKKTVETLARSDRFLSVIEASEAALREPEKAQNVKDRKILDSGQAERGSRGLAPRSAP